MPALSLRQLTRRFPGAVAPALDGLDLEVGDGEFLVITGPSGSGKTTLLRLLAGLESPVSGTIGFGADSNWHRRSPADRGVAMVGQQPALLPQLTVAENLALGLKLRGVASLETTERVRAIAVRLGMEPLLDRLPALLSGGEQQRVSLGRALVQKPSLFLLDEPLSQLDAPLRADLRREISRLAREFGVTTVHVTHDQAEALELGDRIVVLRAGRLEQVGSPAEILRRPVNRFVAEFFSPDGWNELTGTLRRNADATGFQAGNQSLTVPGSCLSPDGNEAMPVVCLLRPECFRVREDGDVPGRILRAWLDGGGWRAEVESSIGLLQILSPAGDPPSTSSSIRLAIRWERALWFDPSSGTRFCGV